MVSTIRKQTLLLAAACSAAAALAAAGFILDNRRVDAGEVTVRISTLPAGLDGLRIAHLSDLHYPKCARSPQALAELVESLEPDLIVLTGDLIDRHETFDRKELAEAAERLAAIAPSYAVAGNHEFRAGAFDEWKTILTENGVTVLDDEWAVFTRDGAALLLGGLTHGKPDALPERGGCRVVLSHYPENFSDYAGAGYDLVLSGHAHGGQVRIFGQGLLSPGEGLFPRYTSGLYRKENTQMVVSRGLRSGWMPPRVGNAPHLPLVVLEADPEGMTGTGNAGHPEREK